MAAGEDPRPDTRERVLQAAREVFAEKGFRDATIHEICDRAEANIAAVNYYFRHKEDLYVEAWRQALHSSLEAYPPDGGVAEDAPAEERLRGRIRALVRRLLDQGAIGEAPIIIRELANPTGLLDKAMHDVHRPLHEAMSAIVRELLGPRAPDKMVRLCVMSMVTQCIALHFRMRVASAKVKSWSPPFGSAEELADHIAKFSLAAIRVFREEIDGVPG
jgi:AcrR family transcriptional regulator